MTFRDKQEEKWTKGSHGDLPSEIFSIPVDPEPALARLIQRQRKLHIPRGLAVRTAYHYTVVLENKLNDAIVMGLISSANSKFVFVSLTELVTIGVVVRSTSFASLTVLFH